MKFLSIIAFVVLMFACYGWGYALVRWTANRDKDDFAFLSVAGIACLIFLGGILNLFHLAYPSALIILFLTGLAFFAVSCLDNAKIWLSTWHSSSLIDPEKLKSLSNYAVPIGILAIAVGFYALTLLPATAFNYADDFYTYIPRPLRMLQTGTLAGNPFEALGLDTLGAHAFLQGFVLIGLPVEYLQGFEAVFSFALAGMLVIAIGKKFKLHWSYIACALIGFIVINPQSVNVSALYLGSAFILGIIFASCQLLEQMEKSDDGAIPIMATGILGLLFAGLIGLKGTFIGYASAYYVIFFTGLLLISTNKRKVLKLGSLVMLAAFLALLPWLALYADKYASAAYSALHTSTVAVGNVFPALKGNMAELLSAKKLLYGDSYLSYGMIVLMLAAAGSYSLFNIVGNRVPPDQRGYFLVATASCTASIINYLFLGFISPPGAAVRYSCPLLIATLPFAWLAASMAVPNPLRHAKLPSGSGMKVAIILPMTFLLVILFWNNFIKRVERAYSQHTTISFPFEEDYIEYNRYVLSSDARQKIRDIQNKTKPGEKVFAWISMPMHLDFFRNNIYSVMNASLVNPWLDIPLNGNADDLIKYFKDRKIRYIMWEYQGYSSLEKVYRRDLSLPFDSYQKLGERGLYLRKMLVSIMNGGGFLYNADGLVLFDLQQIK